MNSFQTAVVGGGAAGLMAAITAAQQGRAVALLEGNTRLGRKILISGNGRCNLTNRDADSVEHYHGSHREFTAGVLKRYPVKETLAFFAEMGLECKTATLGRLFPVTDQAATVLNLLEDKLYELGVNLVTEAKIKELRLGAHFELEANDGRTWKADRVILATGGISIPKLGADDSGMQLAAVFGHQRTALYPGLVPLCGGDKLVHAMHGAKIHAALRVELPTGQVCIDEGDLLFTKYGVSGLAILNLSAKIVPFLEKGELDVIINLLPGKSSEEVSDRLKARWQHNGQQSVALNLSSLFPDKIAHAVLEKLQVCGDTQVSRLSKKHRWAIANHLTKLPVRIREPRSFEFAEVTIGGVKSEEVNPETMESKLVPGCYLAGEMLNVHGDLGGYNFQWAWSSGYLAGLGTGLR